MVYLEAVVAFDCLLFDFNVSHTNESYAGNHAVDCIVVSPDH